MEEEYGASPGEVRVSSLRIRRRRILGLSRQYEFSLPDYEMVPPEFEELIRKFRWELIRAADLLGGRRQELIARRVYIAIASLLRTLPASSSVLPERTFKRRVSDAAKLGQGDLEEIKELVNGLVRRWARGLYLLGLVPGVAFSGFLVSGVYLIPKISSSHAYMLAICLAGGTIGAVASTMTRIVNEEKLDISTEQGNLFTLLAGSFRPIVGAIIGAVLYVLIQGNLLPLEPSGQEEEARVFFFVSLAFLAGFSERWAQDTIVSSTPGIGFRRRGKTISEEEDATSR